MRTQNGRIEEQGTYSELMENGKELFQGSSHDGLVIETVENVVEDTKSVCETLVGLAARDVRVSHRGEETFEGLGMLDASRVIEGEDTENVSGLQADTRLLDKLDDTIF